MKNKISDVRNHLVAQLERLGQENLSAAELDAEIERSKAVALVAGAYVGAVKVEIDAIRLMDDTGRLPVAVEAGEVQSIGQPMRVIQGGR